MLWKIIFHCRAFHTVLRGTHPKKSMWVLPGLSFGLRHSLHPAELHNEIRLLSSLGLIHCSKPALWRLYIHQQTWTCEEIWTLWSHWGEIKKPEDAWLCKMTNRPREVCTRSVTKVEVAGQTQLRANMAYLNSSSHTTWSENRRKWADPEELSHK